MKCAIILESDFKACQKLHYAGPGLLFAVIREAMTGEKPDFKNDDLLIESIGAEAVYEAISPRIVKSALETFAENTYEPIQEDIYQEDI